MGDRSSRIRLLRGRESKILFFSLSIIVLLNCSSFLCSNFVCGEDIKSKVNLLSTQAEANSKKGQHRAAFNLINHAIELQPNNPYLYYQRAFIYGRAGLYPSAVKDFNIVVKSDRLRVTRGEALRFPHAQRFRADCFMALGHIGQAIKDYKGFLERAPKDGKVWSYLVEAYALIGRRDLALDAIQKGLATGSHWSERLRDLQNQILSGQRIVAHKPFSH
jgi:tetratricopeptide (TPR) repeat protein